MKATARRSICRVPPGVAPSRDLGSVGRHVRTLGIVATSGAAAKIRFFSSPSTPRRPCPATAYFSARPPSPTAAVAAKRGGGRAVDGRGCLRTAAILHAVTRALLSATSACRSAGRLLPRPSAPPAGRSFRGAASDKGRLAHASAVAPAGVRGGCRTWPSRTATVWRSASFRPSPRLGSRACALARRAGSVVIGAAALGVAVTELRTSCQSPAKRTIHRAGNLLAGAGSHRAAQCNAPTVGSRR
jgi:hypothetical protein